MIHETIAVRKRGDPTGGESIVSFVRSSTNIVPKMKNRGGLVSLTAYLLHT